MMITCAVCGETRKYYDTCDGCGRIVSVQCHPDCFVYYDDKMGHYLGKECRDCANKSTVLT